MRKIAVTFIIFALLALSFGCTEDGDENKTPSAWLELEPPVAWIYDNGTAGFSYPEVTLNGNQSNDPDGRISYYFYDFGEGNTTQGGQGENQTNHEYQVAGHFEVSLEVEDNDGAKDKASKELTVNYEMNRGSGLLQSGDSESEPFRVTEYSANNATIVLNITNEDPLNPTADARVSITNAADQEVTSREVSGIQDYEVVIIELSKSDLGTSDPGEWEVLVECTDGTIMYSCHLELYYKSW